MENAPKVRLLDLSRSLRRVGRVATGVDRVERAYLWKFLSLDTPCYGLIRTPLGYLLLDRAGLTTFTEGLEGRVTWARADRLSAVSKRRKMLLRRAETTLRQVAVARCLPMGLRRMLSRLLEPGFDYFNVGHSNLTERVLQSVRIAGGRVTVLVHDVIPLELPQMQRPGTPARFEAKMRRVERLAHRVLYPSRDSQEKAESFFAGWGSCPRGAVAPLGMTLVKADVTALPKGLPPPRPYFVTVGTIEPRKNHAFLLDLWADWGPGAPPLLICGTRGWNNAPVFDRLDALPPDGPVRELTGLSDAGLAALIQGAAGLLAPSHGEGFGLPPMEALCRGTRVLASDIPAFREVLGTEATIFPVFDSENWLTTLKKWEKDPSQAVKLKSVEVPSWDAHFKIALRLI